LKQHGRGFFMPEQIEDKGGGKEDQFSKGGARSFLEWMRYPDPRSRASRKGKVPFHKRTVKKTVLKKRRAAGGNPPAISIGLAVDALRRALSFQRKKVKTVVGKGRRRCYVSLKGDRGGEEAGAGSRAENQTLAALPWGYKRR